MQGGSLRIDLHSILKDLERWGASRSWVGPDPYEGLNSPLGRVVPGKRGRQAVTQAYKRLPFKPPWPLAADPQPNAKTLALALSAYASPAGRELRGAPRFLGEIPLRLQELNLLEEAAGWGYPFPVQTRNIRYGTTSTNAIATCFVVEGLLDAFEATGQATHGELALRARPTLLALRQESERGPFFGYVGEKSALIHNANAMVAGAIARLDDVEADPLAMEQAAECALTTATSQREDGHWPYGEAPGFAWVDNFHTAYTLEGLLRVNRREGALSEWVERGNEAWRRAFVLEDGWTPYFLGRRFPLEAHCAATAIDLLVSMGDTEAGERVVRCAVKELWLSQAGPFAFRRSARGVNRREYVRWTNAPMFRALSRLQSSAVDRPAQRQAESGDPRVG